MCIAVRKVGTPLRELTCHMGSHGMSPGRGDIPALTPAEAGTRLSDPGRMQGRVDRDRRLCDVTSPYVLQTNRQFLREYYDRTQNTTGLTGHQEAPYGYDSVWTVALMLNDSIRRMIDEGFACAVLVSTFLLASSPNIHRFTLLRLYLEIGDSMTQIRDIPGNPGRVATLFQTFSPI